MNATLSSVKIPELALTGSQGISNLLSCKHDSRFLSHHQMQPPSFTHLLARWQGGDQQAFAELAGLIHDELHKLARYYMRSERSGHTLQATALINEAYLRLANQQIVDCQSRTHFFSIAARAMRQILVDHARARLSAKRGGGAVKLSLEDEATSTAFLAVEIRDPELLALDEALEQLAKVSPVQCQIVELRYFSGLTIEETAQALKISAGTVKRQWVFARAWLHGVLHEKVDNPVD